MLKLEARIHDAEIVQSGPELVLVFAQLRVDCERIGHALSKRDHDADRWVATTALRLGITLVYNEGIFNNVPGGWKACRTGSHGINTDDLSGRVPDPASLQVRKLTPALGRRQHGRRQHRRSSAAMRADRRGPRPHR